MKANKGNLSIDISITKYTVCIAALMGLICIVVSVAGYAIGNVCYTLDWIRHNGLYLTASVITVGTALLGLWRVSVTVFAGMHLGILLAELFGPNPAGDELGFGHYGWFIWICCFLASILIGVVLEILHSRKAKGANTGMDGTSA